MSDQPRNNDQPLFQNMDEQEQIYAPEQVPGSTMPADEIDRDTTAAGEATARGDQDVVVPAVPVRPDPTINTPIVAPVPTADANDDRARRE